MPREASMLPRKLAKYIDHKRRRSIKALLRKYKKNPRNILVIVIYTIGSIQNKYQERPGEKKSNGDYGRRWRRTFDRMIEATAEDLIKSNLLLVHIDPTRLDSIVARRSMRELQPKLRRLQEQLKLRELYKVFDPIRQKELEVMSLQTHNTMVVSVVHLAETSVSGGSAQELLWADMAGIPVYLYCSEDILKKYRSRHVIMSVISIGNTVVRGRNIFHTAEDVLNKIRKDIPRLRKKRHTPPLGKLFMKLVSDKNKK